MRQTRGEILAYKTKARRTLIGKIINIYENQVRNSKERGHDSPKYSRQDLIDYCTSSPTFINLWKAWCESGYKKDLSPSIDRIDDSKGYSFENIQVMAWIDNRGKYHRGKVDGTNTADMKRVNKTCLKTGEVLESFHSAAEAYRVTGIERTNICKCARGERKSSGGFNWKYIN